MISHDKTIVIDLDGTLCETKTEHQDYADVHPREAVVQKLREYREQGFYVIVDSSRNMNTFEGNMEKINAITRKIILEWLDKHDIPYDEVHVGRPWCGNGGFYVDNKTIRPEEFKNLSLEEINKLVGGESA